MATMPRVLPPERLARLLESYGAASERWPREEREAVRKLIARSASAKRRWEEASYLDHLLDALEPEMPSTALVGRVVSASPARRPGRLLRRAAVVAASLAAAAAVIVWTRGDGTPLRPVPDAARVPLGVYTTATDVLLAPSGLELERGAVGCADPLRGCPDVPGTDGASSRRTTRDPVHA
jgi:hypothetical protein